MHGNISSSVPHGSADRESVCRSHLRAMVQQRMLMAAGRLEVLHVLMESHPLHKDPTSQHGRSFRADAYQFAASVLALITPSGVSRHDKTHDQESRPGRVPATLVQAYYFARCRNVIVIRSRGCWPASSRCSQRLLTTCDSTWNAGLQKSVLVSPCK